MGPSSRSVRYAILVALLAALSIAGCSTAQSQTAIGSGGTVSIRLQGDWGSLEPALSANRNSNEVVFALYDRLVTAAPDGRMMGYLAKSWKETPSSISLTLRRDATCADGTPITPSVVAQSLTHFVTPATKSPWVTRAFGPGPYRVTFDDASDSVALTVATPFNELLYGLGLPYAGITCPSGVDSKADFANRSYGSGPFTLDSATHGDSVRMSVRKSWRWGPNGATAAAPGFPDHLVWKVVDNETTATNLLLTGGLEIADVTGPDIPRLKAAHGMKNVVATSFFPHVMFMNEAPGHPTADPAVRHALMAAVDAAQYNQVANGGFGVVTPSIFGQRANCYEDTSKLLPRVDPASGRSILQAAGYTADAAGKMSKAGRFLNVVVVGTANQNGGPEYLQTQFNSAGVAVTLQNLDFATYALVFRQGKFDVIVATPNIPEPNPSNVTMYYSGPTGTAGGGNWPDIQDSELTRLLAQATSVSSDQRCQYWRQFQERVLSGYHALPLASIQSEYFSRRFDFSTLVQAVDVTTIRVAK